MLGPRPPVVHGRTCPYSLYQSERPCALQEAVAENQTRSRRRMPAKNGLRPAPGCVCPIRSHETKHDQLTRDRGLIIGEIAGGEGSNLGSVQRSGWCRAGKLLNGNCDPAPGIGAVVIAIRRELVDAGAALLERFVAVAFGLRLNGFQESRRVPRPSHSRPLPLRPSRSNANIVPVRRIPVCASSRISRCRHRGSSDPAARGTRQARYPKRRRSRPASRRRPEQPVGK